MSETRTAFLGNVWALIQAMIVNERTEPCCQDNVIAKDQNGLVKQFSQVQTAIPQDHGFARTSDTMNYAMTGAQASG